MSNQSMFDIGMFKRQVIEIIEDENAVECLTPTNDEKNNNYELYVMTEERFKYVNRSGFMNTNYNLLRELLKRVFICKFKRDKNSNDFFVTFPNDQMFCSPPDSSLMSLIRTYYDKDDILNDSKVLTNEERNGKVSSIVKTIIRDAMLYDVKDETVSSLTSVYINSCLHQVYMSSGYRALERTCKYFCPTSTQDTLADKTKQLILKTLGNEKLLSIAGDIFEIAIDNIHDTHAKEYYKTVGSMNYVSDMHSYNEKIEYSRSEIIKTFIERITAQ